MLVRLAERNIRQAAVIQVLSQCDIITTYPADLPYPSTLFAGQVGGKWLHIVASYDALADWIYIITAYEPDIEHFEADFRTRKSK